MFVFVLLFLLFVFILAFGRSSRTGAAIFGRFSFGITEQQKATQSKTIEFNEQVFGIC